MNSEKVKEIKKSLECCNQNEIEDTCKYCLDCPASAWDYEKECNIDLFQKTITLINELEEDKEKWQRKAINYYQMAKSYGIECIIDNDIDETLKEYEE